MSRTLALPELVSAPPADDPYRYGFRLARRRRPDGSEEVLRLPLTIWDFLHPQEEDKLMQGTRHAAEVRYLATVIEARLRPNDRALVMSDTGVYWDVPGLSHHSPDVTVIFDVNHAREQRSSFNVRSEGVRPTLIIEVVSPKDRETHEADTVVKVVEYHKAMVPFYVIVDRENEEDWPTIRGYRYAPEGYESIPLDDHDCLLLEPIGLRLCANQNRITLYDAVTGEEQGDYAAISEALELEVAARQAAEQQARLAKEQARVAQDCARAETELRQKAEDYARAQAESRQQADDRLQAEKAARADLEQRLRDLEQRLPPAP